MSAAKIPKTIDPLDEYAMWTDSVAQYPLGTEPAYLALGIADEFSELLGAIMITTKNPEDENEENIVAEAGDVLWYVARYARQVLNVPLSQLVKMAPIFDADHDLAEAICAPGRICGVEKKRLRDGAEWTPEKLKEKQDIAIHELCSIIAAIQNMGQDAFEIECSLEEMCNRNRAKLEGRLAAGTIHGDGDKR